MSGFNKFDAFAAGMPNAKVNLAADAVKLMLSNTAPLSTMAVYADISATEIANGNGYTTGGAPLTLVSSAQVGGTYKYIASAVSPTWTAGPAAMANFRYIIAYDTVGVKQLIGWWDIGSVVSLSATNTFTATPDLVNGIFQVG